MKILQTRVLLDRGGVASTREVGQAIAQIHAGVQRVVWPGGSDVFTIRPARKANGVKPVKKNCMEYLRQNGWELEKEMDLATYKKPGKIDALQELSDGRYFAFEWETGNISSSHRALSKMAIGLLDGVLAGGTLALPSRRLYEYFTDRVGNFPEIEPYFPLYENLNVGNGYLAVVEFEHDRESDKVPHIPKGTDGRAMR